MLSAEPCDKPAKDDSVVDDMVYLKLEKAGENKEVSYIHGTTYIVIKNENTTEVYTIAKTPVGNKGGSEFKFTIPTTGDKGGKCIDGSYVGCSDNEANKCPTTTRINLYNCYLNSNKDNNKENRRWI